MAMLTSKRGTILMTYIDNFRTKSAPEARRVVVQRLNPTVVNFETRTLCNSTCSFCPVSIQNETRQDESMSGSLFEKVCKDLAEKSFSGILSFQLNNEPLIDKNLLKHIETAQTLLPECRKKITTNGIKLTLDFAKNLVDQGISILLVDNYSDSREQKLRLMNIEDELRREYPDLLVKIQYDRSINENLNTRGGRKKVVESYAHPKQATMGNIETSLEDANDKINYPCYRPFSSLTVTSDGSIGLCCYDVYFELNIGNAYGGNVIDTWHNAVADKIRNELLNGNRSFSAVCGSCNAEYLNDFDLKKMGLAKLERERL